MTENLLKPKLWQTHIFNYRALRVVENAFGIMSSWFGVFQRQLFLFPEKKHILSLGFAAFSTIFWGKSQAPSWTWRTVMSQIVWHQGSGRQILMSFSFLLIFPQHYGKLCMCELIWGDLRLKLLILFFKSFFCCWKWICHFPMDITENRKIYNLFEVHRSWLVR